MAVDTKLLAEVKKILQDFGEEYLTSTGKLKRNKLIEDLDAYLPVLMKELLASPIIRESYVEKIGDTDVFKLNQFVEMLQYKDYWGDSYTKFTNKIGLTVGGKFLDESADVVLDFPFKDTILKAGMTKEDVKKDQLLPNEPFLNETIAKSEIDELLDPKIFVNAKRYDKDGEHPTDHFSDDNNFIIKGNNLLALYSLKDRYAGKVKLIYIDIPYNTGDDSFKYNDQFSRAAWLTFIKNRVKVAFDLLSNDGVIVIEISFHQYAYLKVMLDGLLGEKHHVVDFNVLVRHPERSLTSDKEFNDVVEHSLVYSKSESFKMPKKQTLKTNDDYVFDVHLGEPLKSILLNGRKVLVYPPDSYNIVKLSGHNSGLKTTSIRGSIKEKNSSGRFYVAYIEKFKSVFPSGTIFKVPDMGDDKVPFRLFELPKNGNKNGLYFQGMPQSSKITHTPYANFIDFVHDFNLVNAEGGYEFRNGKKPENFIRFFLNMFTTKNDLVLDFFMGSATTQAVAMKMYRRFIGIEQMDYINDVSVPRLQKVISGEQGGISKDVHWQGGGSFIYTELKEKNNSYLKDIINATDNPTLEKIVNRMRQGDADIDFKVDLSPENLNNYAKKLFNESFDELDFEFRKKLFVAVLDKNQLYYNYSEIDDRNVRDLIDDNDYKFNRSFYARK
ncbi:putative type III restriction-modification system methylation subunit [Oenococcus oeni]|uniref:site-specific DNA-methyltransferase n=1 Tax=Oenococcus oeni TaxID=1247 RepID=UPI00107AE6CD|nr:site-specific DNA-methyltransferase [Oenococcus oeni]AVI93752.1 hypothetical protein AX764_02315 [Oenococcus oeni]SYW00506.1 putative type III restriction-modification system methylation subunit [Oenococcus oeni]SYW01927.1 putative type III restriction-modification system methylation subunit [Oenococcus oeni]SYW18310.1 putative type III restriction-modification system methylation subunit [Oenococcus oeni]VDC14198.1 putative type III restriction-modification system methylation subunit [Oenoc